MRNEPLADHGAEHPDPRNKPWNPNFGPVGSDEDVLEPNGTDGLVTAQVLQSLRDRRRNPDAAGSIAREIIRLGTLAAGLHRARSISPVGSGPSGIEVALGTHAPLAGSDRNSSTEDAA